MIQKRVRGWVRGTGNLGGWGNIYTFGGGRRGKSHSHQQTNCNQLASATHGKYSLRRDRARLTTGSFPGRKSSTGVQMSQGTDPLHAFSGGRIPVGLEKLSWQCHRKKVNIPQSIPRV